MKLTILFAGIACIVTGISELIFTVWAGEASWHLGSPIRQHGRIAGLFAGHPHQSAIEGHHATALRVIDTLEVSLTVHMIGGGLLLAVGVLLLYLRFSKLSKAINHPGDA
jgi:hypothetical protein